MTASAARRARRNQQRRMAAMGVELVTRAHVETGATSDDIAWNVGLVVKELAMKGADIWDAPLAITVGAHPSFPGVITIEGKAAKKAPLPEIAVPPASEDDLVQHFRKTLGIESDDEQTPCPAWIYIDGGNDTAGCGREKGHDGSHSCHGVPPWDDAAWLRAETMIDDD